MVAAVADHVSVPSGTRRIALGRKLWPTWRRAMRPLEHVQINGAGTNVMDDVVRDLDPAYNPNHPSNAPWRGTTGPTAIFSAWNGAAYNYDSSEMSWFAAGGHFDYGGNGGVRINFRADAPAFELFGVQTGQVGEPALGLDLVDEHLFTDGRPRAVHAQDYQIWVPGHGYFLGGGNSPWGASYTGASRRVWHLAEDGTYTLRATHASQVGHDHIAVVHDTDDNVLWHWSDPANPGLSVYDPSDDSFVTVAAATGYAHTSTARWDPDRKLLVLFARTGAGPKVVVWAKTGTKTVGAQFVPANWSGTPPDDVALMGPAVDYVPGAGAFILWANGGALGAAQFHVLTPPPIGGDYVAGEWVWSTLSPAPYNAVTPSAKQANGTLGRFRYDPYLEACILINDIDEKAYAFSLSPGDL